MAPYDDWNNVDDDDDDELQDSSYFDGKRDVILFCIDASPSMLALHDDPVYQDVQSSHLFTALEAAMHIQKRKVLVGPNDSVGIVLFNTTKKSEGNTEIKKNTFVYQPIEPVNAPKIQELMRLLEAAREDPSTLSSAFPPLEDKKVPLADVFTSCNWVLRDGAPKTATKRVFLITDDDDPHSLASSGKMKKQLGVSARTTLEDLSQSGVQIEPFFIHTDDKPFDVDKLYASVLPTPLSDPSSDSPEDGEGDGEAPPLAPHIALTRIADLLAQMHFREAPKRALFSVPFVLAGGGGGEVRGGGAEKGKEKEGEGEKEKEGEGEKEKETEGEKEKEWKIGVKGYALVTEQKKGAYRYFVDLGDRMEPAGGRSVFLDEDRQAEIEKSKLLYGMSLGETSVSGAAGDDEDGESADGAEGTRVVDEGCRPFYTAEEVKRFRTVGLEPGLKLLGFKNRKELAFEDNIKHSWFIYPDEMAYAGSKRTFSALLRSMLAKKKIGLVLALTRRNSSPTFCALLPQAEKVEEGGWNEPPGFHLVPLPFADDIRAAPIEEAYRASDEIKDAARAWIDKLSVKNGAYPPDSYPNPALAYHNAQLQASAFREEYDPESFEDLTLPKLDMIHKRAGKLIKEWKEVLVEDDSANVVIPPKTGAKRKADVSVDEAEIRSKYEAGALGKLRVDQLKDFLKSKSESVSGKKADLLERVGEWLENHA